MKNLEIYRYRCESQGLAWSEYCDLDEWSLSILFDEFDYEDED